MSPAVPSVVSVADASARPPEPVDASLFLNRELSWVAFDERVLEEAEDTSLPVLERLKFLGIVSSNLDEFFMVRVAGLKAKVQSQVSERSMDGLQPAQALEVGRASCRERVCSVV